MNVTTVFACNPESCADINVYPLAKNFDDFIRVILACGSANPVEQIVWMNSSCYPKCWRSILRQFHQSVFHAEDICGRFVYAVVLYFLWIQFGKRELARRVL